MTTSRALRRSEHFAEPHPVRGGSAVSLAHPLDALDLEHARRMLLGRALRQVERSVAEDLVQATLVAALEGADSFEGRAKPTTWLVGILSRKIADHYREGGRRRRLLDSAAELVPAPALDAGEALDTRRYRARLERGLETLTEREREVVLIGGIEEAARADTSARLGVSRSHLRVLWHRAAMKLRAVP